MKKLNFPFAFLIARIADSLHYYAVPAKLHRCDKALVVMAAGNRSINSTVKRIFNKWLILLILFASALSKLSSNNSVSYYGIFYLLTWKPYTGIIFVGSWGNCKILELSHHQI
jgi:hypothetical protein